jgi:hypothetical protein
MSGIDLGVTCPKLLARCPFELYTLGEFAAKALAYMRDVQQLHPLFTDLRLVGKSAKDSPPLASDLSNLEEWIHKRGWESRPPTNSGYSDLGPDGKPTSASRGPMGFRFSLSNLKGWDSKISLGVHTGTTSTIGLVEFTLARKDHPEFQGQPLMGALLATVVRHWPVDYANVACRGWNSTINWNEGDDALLGCRRAERIEVGWLTYAKDASIAQALPPEVRVSALGPGVVFQLTDHFASYENADDIALGKKVRNALAAAGRLRADSLNSSPSDAAVPKR